MAVVGLGVGVETIAFYWEPIIRIYGFQTATELSLMSFGIAPSRMAALGLSFYAAGAGKGLFRGIFAQSDDGNRFQVYLLLDRKQVETAVSHIETELGSADPVKISIIEPVDLIYFQGPHFGDRYGIADAVFNALGAHPVPVLVSGFSGSVIYLVVPGGSVQAAERSLAEAFTVPGS
jgi:hypothetical protein